LLTGASGLLGSELIKMASDQLDIIGILHRRSLRTASDSALSFSVDSGRHENLPVRTVECDLSRQDEIVSAMKMITSLVGNVDFVVNSAGDARFLGSLTDAMFLKDDARRQFEINTFAPVTICSALFHLQWKNVPVNEQRVSILNVSSISGTKVYKKRGQGFYAASKAAANMLTMHMAADFSSYGIRVNALCPNSFPRLVATEVVASNALKILSGDQSGGIFTIGEEAEVAENGAEKD
jgi:NAD(P)-dependent dehydrogenase (short-subunit alcohol dehydrogenase family)